MTIKTSDGIRIIQFIEKTLKITLPKSGFLAGQSVCSALLYLNSKQKDFHVNDLDIFLPKEKLTTKEIQFFNRKQTLLLQNMTGSCNPAYDLNLEFFYENEYMKVSKKGSFLQEQKKINEEVINRTVQYQKYLEKELIPYSKNKIEEYSKITSRNLSYELNDKYTYYGEKNISFHISKQKRIFDSIKKGIFNYIYVKQTSISNVFSPYAILSDFDINCTQIGIDLSNNKALTNKSALTGLRIHHLNISMIYIVQN